MFIQVRNDDLDSVRQLRYVILRTNIILMRTFSSCSVEVKLFLFKSYCSNFYCSHLWYNFTVVWTDEQIANNIIITLWGACLIYILDAAPVKCLRTVIFILWMIWEGHVYIVVFNGWNVLGMQSSHVLCHPLSYRNVPYGIIGLNVYINFTCVGPYRLFCNIYVCS